MRHSLFGGLAAAALLALVVPAAPASAQGYRIDKGAPAHHASAGQARSAYRQGGFQRGHGVYGRGYGYGRGYDNGAGVAAGVVGLAAGAIIGGALDQNYGYYNNGYYPDGAYPAGPYADGAYPAGPYADNYATDPDQGPVYAAPGPQVADSGDAVAYCERTFRSYDPASGTYLGYDGMRHSCP